MFLYKKLREARLEMGWSEHRACLEVFAKFGEKAEMNRQSIINYETDNTKPTANRLYFLARTYKKPLSTFFDGLPTRLNF
jgi:transcriptional regulator with XRE-family HTH domain